MHIVIFYQYFATYDVAGSTRAFEIGRRLTACGHSVSIVTGNRYYSTGERASSARFLWKLDQVENIEVIRVNIPFGGSRRILPRMIGFLWFVPFSLVAALAVRKVDVVVGSSTPLSIGIPAYFFSFVRNVPFVFELRDLWPDCVIQWNIVRNRAVLRAAYWLESFLYNKAFLLIALTEGIARELVKKGIAREKIKIVTNGSNLDLFQPNGVRADASMLAGIPDSAFVCMHAGSFGVANYLTSILDVAEELQGDPSIQFVLMGSGPQKSSLTEEIAKRRLQNVHILNQTSKANVPAFLRRADLGIVFFKPSALTYIFLPNKFFDCLACGCPVVVNFPGEAANFIEEAGAGFYVPADDIDALAERIKGLAADRRKASAMRLRARQLAEKHFGWRAKTSDFYDAVMLASSQAREERGWSWTARSGKRLLDVVGSFILLVLLAIPMAIISGILKVQSREPVFFRQERPGLHGRPFQIIKFRTMRELTDINGVPLPDAKRLTRVGRFLRKTSLDELPELFCVLKGDMSLVGPRPLLVRYLPYFRKREQRRHSVRPGITGWAQVNGRNCIGWDQRLELDIWYVENRTMLLDLKILAKTIGTVILRDGLSVDTGQVESALDEERAAAVHCTAAGPEFVNALRPE